MDVKVKYKFQELEWATECTHQLRIKVIYKIHGKFFPTVVKDHLYWDTDSTDSLLYLADFSKNQDMRRKYVLNMLKNHFKKEEDNLVVSSVLETAYGLFSKKGESFSFSDKELGLIEDKNGNEDENI